MMSNQFFQFVIQSYVKYYFWKPKLSFNKNLFYLRENGSDNYTELVQNISSHLKDTLLIRIKKIAKEIFLHCFKMYVSKKC